MVAVSTVSFALGEAQRILSNPPHWFFG